MNRKQRRSRRGAAPMSRAAFEQQMRRMPAGDPDVDPSVRAFWGDYTRTAGVAAARPHPDGIEILRGRTRGGDPE
ncbi:MAG: hypothetical protein QM809_10190 [Gordonia sp. (in: high G+C Gram-positive bacteria)]|uniref:hypothetical protein n=1 Tax=Gordonia sp. (in: high G+C Gram-positive bacteria) TaxID=84139 RepID=UPI0039E42207